MELVPTVSYVLAIGTILMQVFLVFLVVAWFLSKKQPEGGPARFVRYVTLEKGMLLAFLTSVSGLLLSLFYSNVAGFPPCDLCWYQRIALYPQMVILAIALWKKETAARMYCIALSIFGAIVAIYNSYLQFGGNPLIPCDPNNPCSQRFVFEFGYITIPTMSLTAFLFIIIVLWMGKKLEEK
jgi:disulfide bond formation protein DsbB